MTERRDKVSDEDASQAFARSIANLPRLDTQPMQWLGAGFDGNGRLLQYVAVEEAGGDWLIIHAMPATKQVLKDLGLEESRK